MTARQAPLKVLYINHYGIFGGSQRSILELISGFPRDAVSPYFISPKGKGEVFFKKLGIPYTAVAGGISKFDHTRMGHYKGLRWLILIRELLYAVPTIYTFWKFRKPAKEFDIVHINEITCILPLILAKRWYKKPVVVHARAVFNNDPGNRFTGRILALLSKYADQIVPIDQTVAASIPVKQKLNIVHNSFSFNGPLIDADDSFARQLAGLPRRRLNLGFIGAIHINKGILELLEAIRMCREKDMDVSLIIAGNGNAEQRTFLSAGMDLLGLNQDQNKVLVDFISANQLQDYIHPLGFSANANAFFNYIDVVCFPSYYNALGRPVFEAAFFHKPSIVAIRDPCPDTFIEAETGLKVEEKNARSIYHAISRFYKNTHLAVEMGDNAYNLAKENFDNKKNALKMLDIYYSLTVPQVRC